MMTLSAQTERPVPESLTQALNFTDADLKANREGTLSAAQFRRLWSEQRFAGMLAMGCFLVVTVILIGISFLVLDSPSGICNLLVVVALLVVILLMIVREALRQRFKLRADLNHRRVVSLTGIVNRVTRAQRTGRGGTWNSYELHVDGEVFKVAYKVYGAFVEGGSYEIFYLPVSRIILSAELVDA